jgi:malonyl CoA-acyl carrier protein transacylase
LLAALRVLETEGLNLERDAQFVAGHSLGEYCAGRAGLYRR